MTPSPPALRCARELGIIRRTMLGFEDHGLLSFWLELDFGGTGQGFGGYCLGGTFTDACVRRILKAVGVEKWEDLVGKQVWVIRRSGGEAAWGSGDPIDIIEAPAFVPHGDPFNVKATAEEFVPPKKEAEEP
jgi:hypothetical protein